jgi:VIT1/CCC1 family predicted Fe2+/Mn2+ transporter
MALGFTGAVRLGLEEPDNRALFIGILGCNVAWAIVDGVMYVIGALFERGRKRRLFQGIANAASEEAALETIGAEIDGPLIELTTEAERLELHRWVLKVLQRDKPDPISIRRDDLLGGVAVALLIVVATFPIVMPYLLVSDPYHAVRLSNGIGLLLLFVVGAWWGQTIGARWVPIAAALTLVGVALVLLTIALGG